MSKNNLEDNPTETLHTHQWSVCWAVCLEEAQPWTSNPCLQPADTWHADMLISWFSLKESPFSSSPWACFPSELVFEVHWYLDSEFPLVGPSSWLQVFSYMFFMDAESICSPHPSCLPSLSYCCSVAKSCLTLQPHEPVWNDKASEFASRLVLFSSNRLFWNNGSREEGRLFISYPFSENDHPGPWEAEKSSLFSQSWDGPVAPNPTPCLECPKIYTVFSPSWK